MSMFWVLVIIALVVGLIAGNLMLLKASKKFRVPPDFKPREYDDDKDR